MIVAPYSRASRQSADIPIDSSVKSFSSGKRSLTYSLKSLIREKSARIVSSSSVFVAIPISPHILTFGYLRPSLLTTLKSISNISIPKWTPPS